MILTPAYGRDYKTAKAAIADFNAGKDFIIADVSDRWHGKPVNLPQIPAGTRVILRFAKLRKVATVKIP